MLLCVICEKCKRLNGQGFRGFPADYGPPCHIRFRLRFRKKSALPCQHARTDVRWRCDCACSEAKARGPGSREGGTMPKTVLIVEDNELNMKLFHDLLEAHGYGTIGTRNGIEALDLAREHRPDLILMDIQLPEVSGLEVTKWLKEDDQLKRITVVGVTALSMSVSHE